MSYINKKNKINMLNQSGCSNNNDLIFNGVNIKGINHEILKLRQQASVATYEFWHDNITAVANEYEKECSKLLPDFGKIEDLEQKLKFWHAKGEIEEAEIKKLEKIFEAYNLFYLMSGIKSMKLN